MTYFDLGKKYFSSLGNYRFVVFIWLVCLIYYGLYASHRYVPEAQVYVKSGKSMTMEGIPNLSLMAMGVSQASPDLYLLQSYMQSKDMLMIVEEKLNLRAHYTSDTVDFISRLKPWSSDEDFLAYFRDHLSLDVDAQSGIMFVRAEAYDPQYSVKLTELLILEGEKYINKVGQEIANEEVAFVAKEVDRAEAKLEQSKKDILDFQNNNSTLSPEEESLTQLKVIAELRSEVVQARAELKVSQSFLSDNTMEVASLMAKIDAIEEQINILEASATAEGQGSLGAQNSLFQTLKLRLEFATQVYSTTITALEQTRVEAYRKLKHVVRVQNPTTPDEAAYPRIFYNLMTILIVLSLLYGVFAIVIATIKEQRDG
ncbi:hypothetical protein QGN29_02185 [Temperatibacter marinus]|uniref:Uncharacterized protein n=1 Tax=Temperatibacter marinus TaxID=1456591 RepID=A0AA52EI23_9PROT|nr:hypothetical protein [Temperatibacter marinus]WND03175.1 hypothetical protein QGN29_02185 [Temperatibacter marinus]